MKVTATPNWYKIEGSIPKLLNGHNICPVTRIDTQNAISELEEVLNIPWSQALIARYDLQGVIVLDRPVSSYLDTFGERKGFKRFPVYSSLYYQKPRRGKDKGRIYDKILEMQETRQAIPDMFKGRNIMKAEFSHHLSFSTNNTRNLIEVSEALSPSGYNQLASQFITDYNSIEKMKSPISTIPVKYGQKVLSDFIKAQGVHCLGLDTYLRAIRQAQTMKMIDRKEANRMRSAVRKMARNELVTVEDELLREIDNKIHRAHKLMI